MQTRGGFRNTYMLRAGLVCWMFWVDVASEKEVVLAAFLRSIDSVDGSLHDSVRDCLAVADIACFDFACGCDFMVCGQELQEMGRRHV